MPEPVEGEPAGKGRKKGAKLFIDEEFSRAKPNILKEEGGVVAIAPMEKGPEIEFTVTEREPVVAEGPGRCRGMGDAGARMGQEMDGLEECGDEEYGDEEAPVEEPPPPLRVPVEKKELELEVKTMAEPVKTGEPVESLVPENLPDYEPTLDLRDYNIRRSICWKRMGARRSCRMRRNWKPTRTRSSIR